MGIRCGAGLSVLPVLLMMLRVLRIFWRRSLLINRWRDWGNLWGVFGGTLVVGAKDPPSCFWTASDLVCCEV